MFKSFLTLALSPPTLVYRQSITKRYHISQQKTSINQDDYAKT